MPKVEFSKMGVIVCVAVSLVMGLGGSIKNYGERAKRVAQWRLIVEMVVRTIHFVMMWLTAFYFLIVPTHSFLDYYFLIFEVFVVAHWQFFGECCINCLQEWLLDPLYVCGSDNTRFTHFKDVVGGNNAVFVSRVVFALFILCVSVVALRTFKSGIARLVLLAAGCGYVLLKFTSNRVV